MPATAIERNQQQHKHGLRQVFTRLAAACAHYRGGCTQPEIRRDVAWMRSRPADSALDLACGPGTLARTLARHTRTVVGLDLADQMIRHARGHAPANAHFAVADADFIPCRDASFTLVAWSYALANFPNPARMVAEVRRVLRRGGRLALIEVVAPEDAAKRAWLERLEQARSPQLPTHIMTLSELLGLFQGAGLRLLDSRVQERRRRLRDWLALSACSSRSLRALRTLFLAAARDDRAGLRPFRRNGQWFFYHTVAQLLWQR